MKKRQSRTIYLFWGEWGYLHKTNIFYSINISSKVCSKSLFKKMILIQGSRIFPHFFNIVFIIYISKIHLISSLTELRIFGYSNNQLRAKEH